jgi:hypothetical protein
VDPGDADHCLEFQNRDFAQGVTVEAVLFRSTPAGALTYDDANTDSGCDDLDRDPALAAPRCTGLTLALWDDGGGCVVRIRVAEPSSDANRSGFISLRLRLVCRGTEVPPCDALPASGSAGPVTVRWVTPALPISACGEDVDFSSETLEAMRRGVCPPDSSPTPSPSPEPAPSPSPSPEPAPSPSPLASPSP